MQNFYCKTSNSLMMHLQSIERDENPEWMVTQETYETHEPTTTKREVFTTLTMIHDLLGMMASTIINMKIFVQQLWGKQMDCDDTLDDNDKKTWKKLTQSLNNLPTI